MRNAPVLNGPHSLWETGGVKAARHRRRYVWYGRLVIGAIAQHIQACDRRPQSR